MKMQTAALTPAGEGPKPVNFAELHNSLSAWACGTFFCRFTASHSKSKIIDFNEVHVSEGSLGQKLQSLHPRSSVTRRAASLSKFSAGSGLVWFPERFLDQIDSSKGLQIDTRLDPEILMPPCVGTSKPGVDLHKQHLVAWVLAGIDSSLVDDRLAYTQT